MANATTRALYGRDRNGFTLAGDGWQAARPSCRTPGSSHAWSESVVRDAGNGAMVYRDECIECGCRRMRRMSYVGIASSTGSHGDGRDFTLYCPADEMPDGQPPYSARGGLQ